MDKSVWKVFAKHHYLDHNHNKAARVYVAYLNGSLAGFISVMPQPGKIKNVWRVHRLVVLPDFQGVGLGIRILNDIAQFYKDEGLLLRIVSSAPSLLKALNKENSGWKCIAYGRRKNTGLMGGRDRKLGKRKIVSTNKRISASFYYAGK